MRLQVEINASVKNIFLKIFILIFLCLQGGLALAESEIIYEQYYLTTSKGVKTGFTHVVQRKKLIGQGKWEIITDKHIEQQYKRLNDLIKIVQDQTFIEDESGRPLEFLFSSKNTGEDIKITGRFDRSVREIFVNLMVNGVKDSRMIEFDEEILFPYAINKLYRDSKDKKFRYKTLEPGVNLQTIKIRAERLEDETVLNSKCTKFKNSLNILSNTDIYEWRDENGRIVKEYTSLLDMEQIAADKNDVLEISSELDMFTESSVKVNKHVPDPEAVDQILYKITANDVLTKDIFIKDENQQIIQTQDNTVFLKVKPPNYRKRRFSYPVDGQDYKEYLKSGPFIIIDSHKIKNLSNELREGETNAFKIATKMQDWVYENITEKNFAVDFANSVRTLETGSGDCTEHSILLASLLRAAGIPAKIVIGLVYTDEPEDAFVYHMWVKAYVGEWVSLDPSLPYRKFTPLHIALGESSLNGVPEKADLLMNIVNSFSQLDIEMVNIAKPVIAEKGGKLEIKINLDNRNFMIGNNFVDINLDKFHSEQVNKIKFPDEEEKDYIREAFYNFTRGNIEKSDSDLKAFRETIDPEDELLKVKLALKLINMSYFVMASELLDEVKDNEIWKPLIRDLYNLYLPRRFMLGDKELVLVTAYYALNYKNDPDFVLDLTEGIENYDYIYYLRAQALQKKNRLNEAEAELKNAIKRHPNNLTYKLEMIKILSDKNEVFAALDMLNQVNLVAKAQKVEDKEFWKKFRTYDYWLKVKQFRADSVMGNYYKASYYLTKGETNEALNVLNKLIYKHNEACLFELIAEAYYEIDMIEAAHKYYTKAYELNPNSIKTLQGLGTINFLCGRFKKAENYYQEILDKNPNNIDTLLYMAKLKKYLGKEKESYDYFKQILEIDKDNPEVLYNIGIITANRGQYAEAEKIFTKVISQDPMNSVLWLDLAKVKLAQAKEEDAIKCLVNVNHLDDKNPYYYYLMGLILRENEEEAKKYFEKALELNPNLVEELKR